MPRFMRGASIIGFGEAARGLGLDPHALMRQHGLDVRALTELEIRLPADKVLALLEDAALAAGVTNFGLRMAEGRRISDYGPISLLFAAQPTLRDKLMTMQRYQRMLNDALLLHIEDI